ncbi:MAG: MBL fold metallo-hydrolase [Bernardetiaceae bacterium]|nr:MBL fold metallo-hydrolase [Bernardetiaceae bacterium]
MDISVIDTGFFKLDGGAMFGVVPKAIWAKLHSPDAHNRCTWAMRCLLIANGKQLLLIDTGFGDKQDEKFKSHFDLHGDADLMSSIQKAGYHADEITDVLLTHLHFDHCGGAVRKVGDSAYLPSFKNAKYWSNRAHWQWATQPNPREKASFLTENILPLEESGQLHFIENEVSPFPNLALHFVNGHTEKQMLPLIQYKGHKIWFCADLVPSSFHVRLPYVMAYDTRPLETLNEKAYYLGKAADENWILYFEHDPSIECARIERTQRGDFKIKETLRWVDI